LQGRLRPFPIGLSRTCAVVVGLVPATPRIKALRHNNRGGRDKYGYGDAENWSNLTGSCRSAA
jgi:hypothetical protein